MKRFLFKLPFVFLILLLFTRCNLADDLKVLQTQMDSLQIVIGTPEFNTLVKVEFVDARTDNNIINNTVNVQVVGKDASNIYSNIGTRETNHTTNHGMLLLVVDPKVVDTTAMKTNPIEFDLVVSANGYASTTQRVFLHQAKLNRVIVRLTNLSTPPQGVSVAVNNGFATAGQDGRTTTSALQSMNSGSQTVTVPAGVILKDEQGNRISGTVRSEIIFYDPVSEDAQNAFPGGTSVTATLPNGTTGQVEFVSAGMFTVNLTAGNRQVSTFENGGLNLRTVVPPTLINPNTGLPIKAGDKIEMWSRDKGSGEWVYEKTSTVKLENGQFILEETVTHLSDWNWDFFFNSCVIGPRFVFKGNVSGNFSFVEVLSRLQNTNFDKVTYINLNTGYLQLYYVPNNLSATFEFKDAGWDPNRTLTFTPSRLNISNLCNGQVYEITVTENVLSTSKTVTVNLNLSASSATNAQFVIRPNAYIYFSPVNIAQWSLFYINNGRATVDFVLGTDYQILGYFGNNYGMGTLRLDPVGTTQLRVSMTPNINFTSTSVPETISFVIPLPANNIIDITYNAVLPDRIMNQLR